MARSTLANSPDPHQLFPVVPPLFAPPSSPKLHHDFLVFPTEESEYHWRIVALPSNQTLSRHKSLAFALRKCTRLNQQRSKGARHETN